MKMVEWTSEDAANLRDFLGTPSGRKAVIITRETRPGFSDGSAECSTIFNAGSLKGYELAILNFLSLIEEQPVQTFNDTYPDLDTEQAWQETPEPSISA